MQNISVYIKDPRRAINGLMFATERIWPDKFYISSLYRLRFHRKLNWESPRSFNEKLNWMKLFYHNELFTKLADKYEVKNFVSDRIGEQYVVENYGVYDTWEDIDFTKLPEQFVIKGTHDSGGVFVCKDKDTFNYEWTRKAVDKNRKKNFYYHLREWPYKNIKPRIVIDRFLDDHTGNELRDYKWWCFNGMPTYMYCTIKGRNVFENFYDMNFKPVDINHGFPRHQPEFEKPSQFDLMKKLAAKLSQGIPFVRVDFFQVEEKVYFGEFTFYDWAGLRPFSSYETDLELGQLIELPEPSIG